MYYIHFLLEIFDFSNNQSISHDFEILWWKIFSFVWTFKWFSNQIRGKTVEIDVEVVDAQLDYNLLIGRRWNYAMVVVVSSYFRTIIFLHKERIVKVDQLSYYTSDPYSIGNVPFVAKSTTPYEEAGVFHLKYSSLMGTFTFPPSNFPHNDAQINMITSSTFESRDSWKVPSELEMILYGNEMPRIPFELSYEAIQSFSNSSTSEDNRMNMIIDEYSHLSCLEPISTPNPFNTYFLTDEWIMEVLTLDEMPWNNTHHHSTLFPSFDKIENNFSSMFSSETPSDPQCPISTLSSRFEQNLGNISTRYPYISHWNLG